MDKKYELIKSDNEYLFRIKALRDFINIKVGDIGGYVGSENNLSHEGDCWIHGNAKVFDSAIIYGNAKIFGNAKVFGNTEICDNVIICDSAMVYGNARIFDIAEIFGNAKVFDNVKISGNARVFGNAKVFGNAEICDSAMVYNSARIYKDAYIANTTDYIIIGPMGSRNDYTTFYKTKDGISVNCGCFNGTIGEFKEAVEKTHGIDKGCLYYRQYMWAIQCNELIK